MAVYDFDGNIIKRKNTFLACQMNERFKDATPAEQAKMLKEAYWADYITSGEWSVVLAAEGATASNRSRLKKKGAGWLVALAHLAELAPDLFEAMMDQARSIHEAQMGRPFPWGGMVRTMTGAVVPEGDGDLMLSVSVYRDEN